MMLQLGDDGVVTSVNEEELVYVDKNELEQLIENYQQLEKENEQLKKELFEARKDYILETYADNPIRRDERLKALEKELQRND